MYYLEMAQARKGTLDDSKLSQLKRKSTFYEDGQSDEEEYHISKPFEKDPERHLELITGKPKFTSEEKYVRNDSEEDMAVAAKIDKQNQILETIGNTMQLL